MTTQQTLIPLIMIAASLLGGCTTAVVGGAAAGGTIAHDRRTTGTFIEDKEILLRAIRMRQADDDLRQRSNISIDAYNMQVLLTGQAEDADLVQRLADKITTIPRVRKVFNEVQIGAEGTWGEAASDTYITSKVKLAILDAGIEGFDPLRVKVITSLGTVYLMGLLTNAEADAVTEKVRFVSGVKRVVRLFEYY